MMNVQIADIKNAKIGLNQKLSIQRLHHMNKIPEKDLKKITDAVYAELARCQIQVWAIKPDDLMEMAINEYIRLNASR